MFKAFVVLLCAAALATVAFAQNIYISQPPANTNVVAGSDIVVQLDKPASLTGSEDIAIAIGFFPCPLMCPDVSEVLGDVVYSGPYNAQYHNDYYYQYENFTVTVPSWYSGPVQLGVAHFFLLGAGLSGQLQFANATLNVTQSN